jgi:hypothetical protein
MLYAACKVEVETRMRVFVCSKEYKQHIWDISKWLTSNESTFSLFLSGNKGNGKTTLVKALHSLYSYLHSDEFYSSGGDRHELPHKGFKIIDAKGLVVLAKAYNNPTKENAATVAEYKRIRDIEILCIDDLGAEPRESLHYGDIVMAITDIIHYRYSQQYCTIATSNLSADEIAEYYDERFADRLREMARVINFGNEPSFRINKA